MKLYKEDIIQLEVAAILAVAYVLPSYLLSMAVNNLWLGEVLSILPYAGPAVALLITWPNRRRAPSLKISRWVILCSLETAVLYGLLLLGSFFIGNSEANQYNVFALLAVPQLLFEAGLTAVACAFVLRGKI